MDDHPENCWMRRTASLVVNNLARVSQRGEVEADDVHL
jgi:hypothetical protein